MSYLRRASLLAPALALPALLGACPPEPAAPPEWELVHTGLPGALLSVWGTASDDVWVVGADAGEGPTVLRYDGEAWTRHATGTSGHLWWVSGAGDSVWMSGDGGQIVRHDRKDMSFEAMKAPSEERLYGIFPFADDDVWTCGSDDANTAGVIYHYDGDVWAPPTDLPAGLMDGFACFKVWGPSPDELWFVGYGGAVLHYAGGAWERIDLPGGRPLFTVHGRGDRVVAVGGLVSGYTVELTAGSARDVTPKTAFPQMAGVWVGESATVAAGIEGAVWERAGDGEWQEMPDAPGIPLEYHSVYVDPDGGIWAVGGRVYTNLRDGVLSHYGQPVSSDIF